jgi:hypothetical protein
MLPRFSGLFLFWLLPVAQQAVAQQPTLDCSVGPLSRTYGSTPWLVYACSDGKSVVALTTSNSPAAPFYFMLYPKDGKYAVVGEGTGPKSLTDRAYADLTRLTEQDIAALVSAAKQQSTGGGKQ